MITIRIPDDLRDRIDKVRASTTPREAWVRSALEQVLQHEEALMRGGIAMDVIEREKPLDPMTDPCPQCGARGGGRCQAAAGETCPEGVLTPDQM